MPTHSFITLMRRLSRAGFKRQLVANALIPDWWDESCAQDPALLPEIEVRVARFLSTSLSIVRNVNSPLTVPSYGNAQLRKVRNVDRNRLGPAIHTAIQVAGAVVRNMRVTRRVEIPATDGVGWRLSLNSNEHIPVQLSDILQDLWAKGIPVVPLDILPTPRFQGLACIVEDHPVIVLGHRYDEPGRVGFLVAHEAGHITAGDCSPDVPVVDQDATVQDGSEMERSADRFAQRLLLGNESIDNQVRQGVSPKLLAQQAFDLESQTGADASSIIYSWASKTLDYAVAAMAVKALYRSAGARHEVRKLFDEHVDPASAGESDRELLRCIYGEQGPTAVTDRH